jgi:hypothetical protein
MDYKIETIGELPRLMYSVSENIITKTVSGGAVIAYFHDERKEIEYVKLLKQK